MDRSLRNSNRTRISVIPTVGIASTIHRAIQRLQIQWSLKNPTICSPAESDSSMYGMGAIAFADVCVSPFVSLFWLDIDDATAALVGENGLRRWHRLISIARQAFRFRPARNTRPV